MSTRGHEAVLVGCVVDPVGDTVRTNVFEEALGPHTLSLVVDFLDSSSFFCKDFVFGLIEVVVTIWVDLSFLTDDTIFVLIGTRSDLDHGGSGPDYERSGANVEGSRTDNNWCSSTAHGRGGSNSPSTSIGSSPGTSSTIFVTLVTIAAKMLTLKKIDN